jgi:hypothetical protein
MKNNYIKYLIRICIFFCIFCSKNIQITCYAQNIISVPFTSGFVGSNTGNNASSSSVYLSSLGWTNIQFSQTSNTSTFVAQGNDIIGNVLITDANGVEHTINGYVKWRAPSGTVTSLVFSPTSTNVLAVAGGGSYTINSTKYVGLIFNGKTLTIAANGSVTGNAATTGLLSELNGYLASFPSLASINYSVNEEIGSVTVTVSLSETSLNEVRVNYATFDSTAVAGLDYTLASGTLSFSPGSISKTFVVYILTDLIAESSEYIKILLTDPINASVGKTLSTITVLDNAPMPVELMSFEVQCLDKSNNITWITASEKNSKNFILERSFDGLNWQQIYETEAAGNSQDEIVYSFEDARINGSICYYRLNQYDIDGKSKQYGPISSNCKTNFVKPTLFPNPCNGDFYVSIFSEGNNNIEVKLLNLSGVLLEEQTFSLSDETRMIHFSNLNIPSGIYLVDVLIGNQKYIQKILIN